MPFRPMREDELKVQLKKIEDIKADIAIRQRYLMGQEEELKKGVWYMSDEDFKAMLDNVLRIVQEDNERHAKWLEGYVEERRRKIEDG